MKEQCFEYEIESKGKCVLPVIFRKMQGSVFAMLPTDYAGGYDNITTYEHVGQHGAGDYGLLVANSKPAKPKEYRPLLRELRRRGYERLKVYKKESKAMRSARRSGKRSYGL